ncbi:DUF1153 domain-containing protein [Paracoccus tegillarcae]|uniref:DUF1153 domain-containing protein n=1 Tax=Paracoccus tegillarcae TaxID=1529068 RepID=A0A2K9ESM5_9RHOB|nr:DUF1153 domain-containing protein [Paracoccus tegillarcae]AUH34725.1 DUF1153 domain-containing protein [Paracoccus tegillarcae]
MFIRKSTRPRTITLPDGTILSMADLPADDTRWVASRKATVVNAVLGGLLTRENAITRYSLTEEEFDSWVLAVERHGKSALKVTALQKYRHVKVERQE